MDISAACEPAPQPRATNMEMSHPKYKEWMRYKSACAAQLVTASTFHSWLDSLDMEAKQKAGQLPYQIVNRHPRGEEYWKYSRTVNASGGNPVSFNDWLKEKHLI